MYAFFLLIFTASVVISSPINDDYVLIKQEHAIPNIQEAEIYRLPENVHPEWYKITIIPDLEKSTFAGDVDIGIYVKFTTSTITLHSNVTVKDCQVRMGNDLVISSYTVDEVRELLIIQSPKLRFGAEYILSIKFEGVLNDDMLGFYKTTYTDDKGTKKVAAVTHFQATYARRAFPCFDEPRYKTPFTIKIAHLSEYRVISNMPIQIISTKDVTINNRQWTTFQTSQPMPTYLVAFMVSDFSSTTSSEKIVTVHTRPNAIQYATYATEQGQKLFNSLLDLTGVDYPLPKLDVVALPDFLIGAMENWGMTTFRERYIVLDESNSAEAHKSATTVIISHEFSHQWFGDLVTPAWWDYTWLNEGFATYYEYFNTRAVESSWDLDQLFVIENVQFALWNEIIAQRAMTSSVRYVSEPTTVFDVISYPKAASVIRMFEHVMTSNSFRNALNRYLLDGYKNHKGIVTPNVLFKAFEAQAAIDSPRLPPHISIAKIMKSWTENIGYPLVTVERNANFKKVKFEQSTYKSTRSATPTPDQEWIIPITYATKSTADLSDTRPTLWSLAHQSLEISNMEPTDWVLCNLQQSGYYRVNYCHHGWHLLIQQLKDDPTKIPVLNRAQLIDDAFALASDGYLSYSIPLQLATYLEKEQEITPWLSAIEVFYRMHSQFRHTDHFNQIRIFIQQIMEKAYKNLGFEIKSTDRHIVKVGKPPILMIAARVGVEQVVKEALQLYKNHINDLTNVQPDLKRLVFCNALRYADKPEEVYDNLWSTYSKSNIAYDSNIIFMTLGCAKDERILKKTVLKVFGPKNDEIRKQDIRYIVSNFFSFPESVTTTIKFLIEREATITELSDEEYLSLQKAMSYISLKIETAEQIQLLEELQTKLSKHDQTKYVAFAKSVHNAHSEGNARMKSNEQLAVKLSHTLTALDNHKDDHTDLNDHSTKTPQFSAAPALLSSWLCTLVLVVVFIRNNSMQ